MVAGTATTATANLRMIGPTASGLNLAHIGGKPVLLASKSQSAPIQGATGQVITNQTITVMLSILYLGCGLTSYPLCCLFLQCVFLLVRTRHDNNVRCNILMLITEEYCLL